MLPEVPVTVSTAVSKVAPPLAVSCRELVEAVLEGVKIAVTPLGNPEIDRLTEPENPFSGLTVIVLSTLAPCKTDTVDGVADSVKLGVFPCS